MREPASDELQGTQACAGWAGILKPDLDQLAEAAQSALDRLSGSWPSVVHLSAQVHENSTSQMADYQSGRLPWHDPAVRTRAATISAVGALADSGLLQVAPQGGVEALPYAEDPE